MWNRARRLWEAGRDLSLVPAIEAFWKAQELEGGGGAGPTVPQYLAIEEFTVLSQIQNWTAHRDKAVSDLARRFLDRRGLAMVEGPDFSGAIAPDELGWESALRELVGKNVEYDPPEMYCLVDRVRAKDYQPYFPEKESDEQSVNNAIRVKRRRANPSRSRCPGCCAASSPGSRSPRIACGITSPRNCRPRPRSSGLSGSNRDTCYNIPTPMSELPQRGRMRR